MQIISNRYLAVTDLPGDRSKRALFEFAVAFDGYAWWGGVEGCGAIANAAAQRWEGTGELPKSLTVLRSCLFFEQRRVHFTDFDEDIVLVPSTPEQATAISRGNADRAAGAESTWQRQLRYMWALGDAVRQCVESDDRDDEETIVRAHRRSSASPEGF